MTNLRTQDNHQLTMHKVIVNSLSSGFFFGGGGLKKHESYASHFMFALQEYKLSTHNFIKITFKIQNSHMSKRYMIIS